MRRLGAEHDPSGAIFMKRITLSIGVSRESHPPEALKTYEGSFWLTSKQVLETEQSAKHRR
jgi:hypothetical protein